MSRGRDGQPCDNAASVGTSAYTVLSIADVKA